LKPPTHVIHHHVVQMLNVGTEFAHVYQNTKVTRTVDADLNVFKTANVHETKHVCEPSAKTRVLELAVKLRHVTLSTILPSVAARTEWLEIHLWHAIKCKNQLLRMSASRRPVGLTVNVAKLTVKQYVHVYLDTLVRLPLVDQNVWRAQNVRKTRLVRTRNAETLVRVLAESEPNAKLSTTILFVRALLDTLGIRLFSAVSHLRLFNKHLKIHAILLRVDRSLSAVILMDHQVVPACRRTLEHHLNAGLSALVTQNVLIILPALIRNVKTRVLDHVELVQFVELSATLRTVSVLLDIPVIPSDSARLIVSHTL